jgi:2-haloacid dehalogenase
VPDDVVAGLVLAWYRLDPWPDAVPGLLSVSSLEELAAALDR